VQIFALTFIAPQLMCRREIAFDHDLVKCRH
jgi:hypothetical protein